MRLGAGVVLRTAASADGVAGTIWQDSKFAPLKKRNRSPGFGFSGPDGLAVVALGSVADSIAALVEGPTGSPRIASTLNFSNRGFKTSTKATFKSRRERTDTDPD